MYWSMKIASSTLVKSLVKTLANNRSLAGLLVQGMSLALLKMMALVIA
jgi:hypothetical protein